MDKLDINEFIRKVSFLSCHKFKIDIPKAEVESDIIHIKDLMALSDDEFVETVYRKILRRAADSEGKIGKVEDLANDNRTRLDIISELKSSEEAQNYKEITILGLTDVEPVPSSYDVDLNDFINKEEFSDFEFALLLDYLNAKHEKYTQWLSDYEGLVFDLLEYDGIDFIVLTYKVLLQRDPDYSGFMDYIENFDGTYISKVEVIYSFSKSDEYQVTPVIIKDLALSEVSDLDSPEQISFDMSVDFNSLHHFLHLRSEKYDMAEMSMENLADQPVLNFMYLLMEKLHVPFSERLGYFNKYIPIIMRKDRTKIDIVYQLISECEWAVSPAEELLSINENPLNSFFNKDKLPGFKVLDIIGKNVFSNTTSQDIQTNNVSYMLKKESFNKDVYHRCKERILGVSSSSTNSSSVVDELHMLTKCIADSATKNEMAELGGFLKGFIEHVDLMAEVLVDHENKMNDWESSI